MRWPRSRERGRHRLGAVPVAGQDVDGGSTPEGPDDADAPEVRLGFRDGTEVELASADPRAEALRAVADVLLKPVR